MYSIYDLYKNDLDERYTNTKEKSASSEGGVTDNNIAPFLNQQQAVPQQLPEPLPGKTMSLYDWDGQYTPNPTKEEFYGDDVDWTQYPSPKGFTWAANNIMLPAFTTAASIAGGLPGGVIMGTAADLAKRQEAGMETNLSDAGRIFGTRALTGVINQFTPLPTSNNPFVDMAINKAKSELTSQTVNSIFNKLSEWWSGDIAEEGVGAGQAGEEAGRKAAEGLLKGNVSEEELSGGEYDMGSNVPSDWSGYDWGDY